MRLVKFFNENYFGLKDIYAGSYQRDFEIIEEAEGIKVMRSKDDPPMTFKVFNIYDSSNTSKTLKLSLHARYWNKVTTFKNFTPKKT